MAVRTACFAIYFSPHGKEQLSELRELLATSVVVTAVALSNDVLLVSYRDDSTDLPVKVELFQVPKTTAWGRGSDRVTDRRKLQETIRSWEEQNKPQNIFFSCINSNVALIFYR